MPRRALLFVTAVAFVTVGAFLTWHGLIDLLARVPGVGKDGVLTVSRCEPVSRGGVACAGTFAASDGSVHTVSIQGVEQAGATVEATMLPWDDSRAYAPGAASGAVGATAFGATVLGIGVTTMVMVARAARRAIRHRESRHQDQPLPGDSRRGRRPGKDRRPDQ